MYEYRYMYEFLERHADQLCFLSIFLFYYISTGFQYFFKKQH